MIEIKTHIEKVNIAALEALQIICRQTFLETYTKWNTQEDMKEYLAKNFNKKKLEFELNNPNSECYFAKIEKQIVGYLKLNFGEAQTEENLEDTAEIERIYVLEQFHGRSAGKALCAKAVEIANGRKVRYLWLGVSETNHKAIQFYKKRGFDEFGKHVFTLGKDEQTDLMMKLEIRGTNILI